MTNSTVRAMASGSIPNVAHRGVDLGADAQIGDGLAEFGTHHAR